MIGLGGVACAAAEALTAAGETWIEDPANSDMRQPRARARATIGGGGSPSTAAEPQAEPVPEFAVGPAGDVTLHSSPGPAEAGFVARLGAVVVSAAGGDRPPRRHVVQRLAADLVGGGVVKATIAGAHVVQTDGQIHIARETRDSRGRPCREIAPVKDRTVVWDGRFEVTARVDGLTLAALAGRAARLDRETKDRLAGMHPIVRAALPALIDRDGAVGCPTLRTDPRCEVRDLVAARLSGALGVIRSESDLDHWRDRTADRRKREARHARILVSVIFFPA